MCVNPNCDEQGNVFRAIVDINNFRMETRIGNSEVGEEA